MAACRPRMPFVNLQKTVSIVYPVDRTITDEITSSESLVEPSFLLFSDKEIVIE